MEERLKTIGDYWSQRSKGFSEYVLEHIDEDEDSLYLKLIHDYADGKQLKVLDIGCGPGLFSIILGKAGHNVTAIDYSDGMLEKAKKNAEQFGVKSTILKMDAQNLEFPDVTFDLIVSRKVVWNLPDPRRAYSEWLRVLKKGGRMILFDGNYFLGMFDEDYKMNVPFENDSKEQVTDYQGADPRILCGFAKELPLSKERRPQWDIGVLTELGVEHIEIDIDHSRDVETKNGLVHLPDTFVITVLKK